MTWNKIQRAARKVKQALDVPTTTSGFLKSQGPGKHGWAWPRGPDAYRASRESVLSVEK